MFKWLQKLFGNSTASAAQQEVVPNCVKCGKNLHSAAKGKISMGSGDSMASVELRCDRCSIAFCKKCAGRKEFKTTCPRCGQISNPPMLDLS